MEKLNSSDEHCCRKPTNLSITYSIVTYVSNILARSGADRHWGSSAEQRSATQSFSRASKPRDEAWMAPSTHTSFPNHHLLPTTWGQQQAGKVLICTMDKKNKDSLFLSRFFFFCAPLSSGQRGSEVRGNHPVAKVMFGWR